MKQILELLEETGFKSNYKLEEKDFIETYEDVISNHTEEERKSGLEGAFVSHIIGTLEGLYISNVSKHIPIYSRLGIRNQIEVFDLIKDYKIFFDKKEMNFFVVSKMYLRSEEEKVHLIDSCNEIIKVLLEAAIPNEYARYIFMDKKQQLEEVDRLIEKTIMKFGENSGLFENLIEIIPKTVIKYGRNK